MSPNLLELSPPLTRCRLSPATAVTPSPLPYLSLCFHHESDILNADPELTVPVIPGL